MFVNELSLVPAAVNVAMGQSQAKEFVLTMRAAAARGVQRTLRMPEDFFAKALAPNYFWQSWLNDHRVARELRQYFRSLATKAPFLSDDPVTEAAWAATDCRWRNQTALGLKAAYVADGLALSMRSGLEWNSPFLECEIQEIVEEDISCRSENIHHASLAVHLDTHTDWIHERIKTTVTDGEELWRRFDDFFPSLTCCSVVEEQMTRLPTQSLASILRGLFRLNTFCVAWQDGKFDPSKIGCTISPESRSTLQMYGAERTFWCPDGVQRRFSWHAKMGRWRIYFDPAPGPGQLYIGYVGEHLGTAKFH